jgi:hypothetical protein
MKKSIFFLRHRAESRSTLPIRTGFPDLDFQPHGNLIRLSATNRENKMMNLFRNLTLSCIKTVCFLAGLGNSSVQAQEQLSISLFNHATTLPPKGFAGPLHPGIDIGISTHLKPKENTLSFYHWKLGYYYHRLVHQGIQVYGEYHKQYTVLKPFGLGWSGGLGYLHTFELHEKFILGGDGTYRRTGRLGKPHAQASLAVQLFGRWGYCAPFAEYRVRLVSPFVNKYVPLLPSTSLHIGAYFNLKTIK